MKVNNISAFNFGQRTQSTSGAVENSSFAEKRKNLQDNYDLAQRIINDAQNLKTLATSYIAEGERGLFEDRTIGRSKSVKFGYDKDSQRMHMSVAKANDDVMEVEFNHREIFEIKDTQDEQTTLIKLKSNEIQTVETGCFNNGRDKYSDVLVECTKGLPLKISLNNFEKSNELDSARFSQVVNSYDLYHNRMDYIERYNVVDKESNDDCYSHAEEITAFSCTDGILAQAKGYLSGHKDGEWIHSVSAIEGYKNNQSTGVVKDCNVNKKDWTKLA